MRYTYNFEYLLTYLDHQLLSIVYQNVIFLGVSGSGHSSSSGYSSGSGYSSSSSYHSSSYRGKRSTVDNNALEFAAIAQIEPEQCYRRLICDLATGQMPPSENDVILSLFDDPATFDVTSPAFEFAVAAEVGRHVKDISMCELRYSCPVTGIDLLEATA